MRWDRKDRWLYFTLTAPALLPEPSPPFVPLHPHPLLCSVSTRLAPGDWWIQIWHGPVHPRASARTLVRFSQMLGEGTWGQYTRQREAAGVWGTPLTGVPCQGFWDESAFPSNRAPVNSFPSCHPVGFPPFLLFSSLNYSTLAPLTGDQWIFFMHDKGFPQQMQCINEVHHKICWCTHLQAHAVAILVVFRNELRRMVACHIWTTRQEILWSSAFTATHTSPELQTRGGRSVQEAGRIHSGAEITWFGLGTHTSTDPCHQNLFNLIILPSWHLRLFILHVWPLFFIIKYLYYYFFQFCACTVINKPRRSQRIPSEHLLLYSHILTISIN